MQKKGVVEYADWSLSKFINLAKKQDWYENTIFVFIADHGAPISTNYEIHSATKYVNTQYDISLNYVHIPLLFYAPSIIKNPKTFTKMAGQIDVFPSIMGLLKIPYKNGTMGINLFKKSKPYAFFNGDDKYGVIDNEWLLIAKQKQGTSLHKYRSGKFKNYAKENPDKLIKMKRYAESYMQSFQYLKNNYNLNK